MVLELEGGGGALLILSPRQEGFSISKEQVLNQGKYHVALNSTRQTLAIKL